MSVAALDAGVDVGHGFAAGRGGYLYLIEGALDANGNALATGDAVKITEESQLTLKATAPSTHQVTIRYDDIDGGKHESEMQMGKGGLAKNMMRGGLGAMGLGGRQKFGR